MFIDRFSAAGPLWRGLVRLSCLLLAAGRPGPAPPATAQELDFTRDVRPILSNACFQCHGPDEQSREADLRLDQKDGLFRTAYEVTVVKPGHPSESELVHRILSNDPDVMMPPPAANKPLSEQQKQVLVRWIQRGAPWQEHWSFVLPQKPVPPVIADSSWGLNEIDQFLLARMNDNNLQPNAVAGPYTLVRRLYLDLIGLQPTPDEADHWVRRLGGQVGSNEVTEINEEAWQQLVSELFASPHYGERWARRWLDLARYADTNGYEKDRERSIWPYRDWVINAINRDLPFDRFTIEQLAGDMLPGATIQQRIATGFHRNTMLNEEGGIDPLEFRYHAMTDRVATTGTTWLGLTLGCCQCHTHKYDPISHHEYFQVMAYLNNADEPTLELADEAFEQQWEKNRQKASQLISELPNQWPVDATGPVDATILRTEASGAQNISVTDSTIVVSGDNPATAQYVIDFSLPAKGLTALKLSMTTLEGRAGPGRTPHGNFVLTNAQLWLLSEQDAPEIVELQAANASVEQEGFPAAAAIDDNPGSGWAIHKGDAVPQTASITFRLPDSLAGTDDSGTNDTDSISLRLVLEQNYGTQHTVGAFQIQGVRQRSDKDRSLQRQQQLKAAYHAWLQSEKRHAVNWEVLPPRKASSNLPILTIQDDHSVFASGDTAKRDDYFVHFAGSRQPVTALRLEALPDERLPARGPGSTYYEGTIGDFYLAEFRATSGERSFRFKSASHTFAKNRFGNNPAAADLAIDGDVQTGWSVHGRQGERHVAVFILEDAIPANTPFQIQMTFGRHFASSLGRFRISATAADTEPHARTWDSKIAEAIRNGRHSDPGVETQFLLSAPQLAEQAERIRKLQQRPQADTTLVLQERPPAHPRPTYRHHRGEYLQPRDQVRPGLPAILNSRNASPANRLEFARWLVSGDNPLTARVVVNRHWAAFFGEGLVPTLDDFGLQGQAPSHPRLLDWLAVTFRDDDQWSLRKLHRRIVSSAAYRQAAGASEKATRLDPSNRLISHFPRYRLDAEIVRDQLLVAAGVLSDQIGGPSVRPPQPAGITEVAFGSPKWTPSTGEQRYRRSIYTFSKRTAPFAMYSTFDAPTGEACIAKRNRSNSPLQALTLLNDVMVMELASAAGHRFAQRAAESDDRTALALLFRSALVRPPSETELQSLTEFLQQAKHRFARDGDAADQLIGKKRTKIPNSDAAAFTAVARVVFALDETQTRE